MAAFDFGLPGVPELFYDLERIVADKVYLLSPDLQTMFVLLMSDHRVREDGRTTIKKMARTQQAHWRRVNAMKAESKKELEEILACTEKDKTNPQDKERLGRLVERQKKEDQDLDNAEKREEEINEEQRKLAERLEKNEKSSLRLLSQFMDRVFLQYQQITQEYEKEIQQYRRSVDSSKCWLR